LVGRGGERVASDLEGDDGEGDEHPDQGWTHTDGEGGNQVAAVVELGWNRRRRGRVDTAEVARRSARVTHENPGAVDGAVAQAIAVATASQHRSGEPLDVVEFVATVRDAVSDPLLDERLALAAELSQQPDPAEIAAHIGVGLLAAESVPAAICAFACYPASFSDAVTLAVSLGGDTDTIASMTGAISGALLGEQSIPTAWIERTTIATDVRDRADALYTAALRP